MEDSLSVVIVWYCGCQFTTTPVPTDEAKQVVGKFRAARSQGGKWADNDHLLICPFGVIDMRSALAVTFAPYPLPRPPGDVEAEEWAKRATLVQEKMVKHWERAAEERDRGEEWRGGDGT